MELHCFQKMMFSKDDDTEKCLKKCLCLTVDYVLLKASPFAELLLLQQFYKPQFRSLSAGF